MHPITLSESMSIQNRLHEFFGWNTILIILMIVTIKKEELSFYRSLYERYLEAGPEGE